MASIIKSDNGVSSGITGIVQSADSSGQLVLQTTTSGGTATTAVTIDNSQNVGVGVTPSAWTTSSLIALELPNGTALWRQGSSPNTWLSTNVYFNGSNFIYKGTAPSSAYNQSSGQHVWYTAPSGTAGNAITFTQAMTLDSSGNLLVGTTTSAGRLTVKGTTTDNSTTGITVQDSSAATLFYVRNDGLINTGVSTNSPYNATTVAAANLLVTSSGTLSRAISSLKYKREVQDAIHGLKELLSLRSVTYKGKNPEDGEKIVGGLIAEEVHEAGLTEFVMYAEDGSPDSLFYGNMVSLCVKAIQELSAQVTTLQTQVTSLQATVQTQATTIATLQNKIGA